MDTDEIRRLLKRGFTKSLELKSILRRRGRSPLFWLLLFTFLHGLWYAFIVHPWQAPDEYVHYEYLRGFINERSLDPFSDGRSGTVQHEIIDSMLDFQHFRYRQMPLRTEAELYDNPTPLGGVRLYPHPPLYYLLSLPFYALGSLGGPLTQLYFLRMFSVVLMTLTAWLTYRLAAQIFGDQAGSLLPFFPAAFVALLPQYTFISSSYNNDSLTPPLIAAALYFIVRGYKRSGALPDFALGLGFGLLAILAKRTAIGILPVLAIALLAYAWIWTTSANRWLRLAGGSIWAASAMLLIVVVTYLLRPPTLPPDLARLLRMNPNALVQFSQLFTTLSFRSVDWGWFFSFMVESFWGYFGWLTLRLPQILREILLIVSGLLAFGLLGALARLLQVERIDRHRLSLFAGALLLVGVLSTLAAMLALYLLTPETYPPQGRYLFPFLPALAILGTWSWRSFWPGSWRAASMWLALFLLAALDLYAWAYIILPGWYS